MNKATRIVYLLDFDGSDMASAIRMRMETDINIHLATLQGLSFFLNVPETCVIHPGFTRLEYPYNLRSKPYVISFLITEIQYVINECCDELLDTRYHVQLDPGYRLPDYCEETRPPVDVILQWMIERHKKHPLVEPTDLSFMRK